MKVVDNERKEVLWVVVYYNVIEAATENDEIGLRGFGFDFFKLNRRG